MNQPAVPTTTTVTFVVRFWRETSVGEARWRGRIEHVQSGKSVAFLEIEAMLGFMQRFGVTLQDQNQPTNTVQVQRT